METMKRTFGKMAQEGEEEPTDAGTDSNVPRVAANKRRKIEKGEGEEIKLTATLDVSKWSFDPNKKRDIRNSTVSSINKILGINREKEMEMPSHQRVKCTLSNLKDFKLEVLSPTKGGMKHSLDKGYREDAAPSISIKKKETSPEKVTEKEDISIPKISLRHKEAQKATE